MTSLIANQRFYNSVVGEISNLINLTSSMASSSKDSNNNNHNLGEMMSTSTSTIMTRPLIDIVDRKVLHHGDILGPIPNLFKWLHNELQRVEKNLQSSLQAINHSNSASIINNTIVELALIKEEQNMEIIFYNQQYYFEVVRTFRVQRKSSSNSHDHDAVGSPSFNSKTNQADGYGGEKPKAWFCKEIEERIAPMRPAQTWLNGKELFCCLLCNHFSFYSNHLMLHMMFDCPKRTSHNNTNNTTSELSYLVNNNGQQHHQSSIIESSNKTKQQQQQQVTLTNSVDNQRLNSKQHRSFDIMSLLNNKNDLQHNHNNHVSMTENKNKNQQSIVSLSIELDKDLDEELVDVETLDSNEEPVTTITTTNIQQMKANTILSKRQLMQQQQQQMYQHQNLYASNHQATLISHNHSKDPPSMIIRKYNGNNNNIAINRKYSNKAGNRSDSLNALTSSGQNKNNNKSAFKKFRNPKNSSINNKNSGNNSHNQQQSSFISNSVNLNNFYNQLSTSTNGTTTSTINNPLFSFANLFRTTTNNNNSNQNQVTNQIASSNVTSESIPLISQLYPFISNNNNNSNATIMSTTTDGSIQNPKLPVTVSPSSGQQNPTSNLLEANNTIASSSATNNICHTTIGNCSLESNSPTLSFESSNSERNSPTTFNDETNKEKSIDDLEPSSMIQLLPQSAQSTMANNPLFNLPPYFMPPTSTAASNPLITSLYLLSPSLTALSYQASNVCAYCNTAFRMTSDLVYHMRSHHKRTQATDNVVNKKRRDDQLRCHICNETFRERHHLTRHMTSHQ